MSEREASAAAQLALDVHQVMQTEGGRRFVYWLLEKANVYHSVCEPKLGFDMVQAMLYNAGRQDYGRSVTAFLEDLDAGLYSTMLQERHQRGLIENA